MKPTERDTAEQTLQATHQQSNVTVNNTVTPDVKACSEAATDREPAAAEAATVIVLSNGPRMHRRTSDKSLDGVPTVDENAPEHNGGTNNNNMNEHVNIHVLE
jgi:hypothetical protein